MAGIYVARDRLYVGFGNDLNNLQYIFLGFARSSQTDNTFTLGSQGFYISAVTLMETAGIPEKTTDTEALVLDGVSPIYELYPITNAANMVKKAMMEPV